jgi:hypothetical protein
VRSRRMGPEQCRRSISSLHRRQPRYRGWDARRVACVLECGRRGGPNRVVTREQLSSLAALAAGEGFFVWQGCITVHGGWL